MVEEESLFSDSRSTKAMITVATPEEVPGMLWLRNLASLRYTTSQEGISVQQLSKLEPFNLVSLVTLQRWSAEDSWVEARKAYHIGIKQRVESAIGNTMVRTRVAQLKTMTGMFEDACGKLDSSDTRVGTYEGLLMVIIRLADQLDKMREKISSELVPSSGIGVSAEQRPLKASLSEEEAREASKAVIRMRREQMRKKLVGEGEDT